MNANTRDAIHDLLISNGVLQLTSSTIWFEVYPLKYTIKLHSLFLLHIGGDMELFSFNDGAFWLTNMFRNDFDPLIYSLNVKSFSKLCRSNGLSLEYELLNIHILVNVKFLSIWAKFFKYYPNLFTIEDKNS